MVMADTVEYWENIDGDWYWHLRFSNGRIAGHQYNSRQDAVEGFHDANSAVFSIMSELTHQVNTDNGWIDKDGIRRHKDGTERTFGDEIALLHSEVSEALEEMRDGRMSRYYVKVDGDETVHIQLAPHQPYPSGQKPIGVPSEAADILVRLLDFCDKYDIDLYREWLAKVQYNATRGHRHGGKAL
jgi:uncharacterized protein YegP (UPF0339 family)